jgi:hypothetical protein
MTGPICIDGGFVCAEGEPRVGAVLIEDRRIAAVAWSGVARADSRAGAAEASGCNAGDCRCAAESRLRLTNPVGSELNSARQCAVDDQVGAGDETRRWASEENDGAGDLLRRAHPARRVQSE